MLVKKWVFPSGLTDFLDSSGRGRRGTEDRIMVTRKLVAFVNTDGSVDVYQRSFDDSTLWAEYSSRLPVDVIRQPTPRPAQATWTLLISIIVAVLQEVGGLA